MADEYDDFDDRNEPLGAPKVIVGSSSQSLEEILDKRKHLVPEGASAIAKGMPIYNAGEVYYPVQFYKKREQTADPIIDLELEFPKREDLADFVGEIREHAKELVSRYERRFIGKKCDNSYHQTAYLIEGRVMVVKHNAVAVDTDKSYAHVKIY